MRHESSRVGARHWAWAALCLLPLLVAAQTPADLDQAAAAEAAAAGPDVALVRFRGSTLFEIRAPIGSMSTAERASAIERRLLDVASGPDSVLANLRVIERDGFSEIYAGDALVRAVTDRDAERTGRTRRQLAADQLLVIRDALEVEFRDRSIASLLRGALLALGASVVLAGLLLVLRRFHRRWQARVTALARSWRQRAGAHVHLLSPAAFIEAGRTASGLIAWLIAIALFYFYLDFVLSLFPWTRGIAAAMVATVTRIVKSVLTGFVSYLPDLFSIAVIVVIARVILKGVRRLFDQIAEGRLTIASFYPEWAAPTYSLVRFFVIAVAAVMVFPYLPGSGSEGFKGVSVFLGLLVSLGAASAIANVIAGIVITYMRPFRVGERVKIADAVGDVTGKDLFVVRLRTVKNVDITIPNSLVLANHIVNFSSSAATRGLVLHTKVTIGYDVPWRKVHELMIGAARRVEGILESPAPFVLQTSLDDFSVSYELNAFTDRPAGMAGLYSRLHAEVLDAFNAAGVEIMSPAYTAVRDGNRAAIPEEHLPKDYRAPAFSLLSRVLQPDRGSS
jgi:small-conductance mechanosensitive channel